MTKKPLFSGFFDTSVFKFKFVVPEDGLEPSQYLYWWILSPLRLPISPLGHCFYILYQMAIKINHQCYVLRVET